MITGEQIKSARKLLGWSLATLAGRSGRSYSLVAKAESGMLPQKFRDGALSAIFTALEAAGVEFTNGGQPGVRMRVQN